MVKFMSEDFMLSGSTARKLYHGYAENMPIIDYHCHIDPKQIAENKKFNNITEIWLGGDHYKWRAIRSNGVEEKYVTGNASDYDKFKVWAATLPKLIGNPLYHWSHLELKTYFGYDGVLDEKTCDKVWELCNDKLREDAMSVRGIISRSNVKVICTTDDPVDSLIYHKAIAKDKSFGTTVLPAWRPDKGVNIDKDGFAAYIAKLSCASGVEIKDFASLTEAYCRRLDYFDSFGCRASDHGLDYIVCRKDYTEKDLDKIIASALSGKKVTLDDAERYKSALLLFFGREYKKRGWVMQLHYGVARNVNTLMFKELGPDTGFDAIANTNSIPALAQLFDAMNRRGDLPKTIIYSINPAENTPIVTVMGCFQGPEAKGKLQHGSAWWFNDSSIGMRAQLRELAACGVLGNFIGMLTDSRSFLSYTRHDYFRRILCDVIGEWVDRGEYPDDIEYLGSLVRDISYCNAEKYFDFQIKEQRV